MLRIRLSRTGKKRYASYRIVVAEIEAARDGRYVEQIGHYSPMTDPATYELNEERALHWLSVGAQPSDAVRRLLERQGTFGRLERLHAGEPAAKLAAEYEGRPWPPVAAEAPASGARKLTERAAEVARGAVERVEAGAATILHRLAEAVENAADALAGDDVAAEAMVGDAPASTPEVPESAVVAQAAKADAQLAGADADAGEASQPEVPESAIEAKQAKADAQQAAVDAEDGEQPA